MADKVRNAIDGIDWDIQVEPWYVIACPTPVTVDMFPGNPRTNEDYGGFGEIEGGKLFTVRARTNTPDSDAARDVMLALMDVEDAHSVAVALEEDQTLNGYSTGVTVVDRTGVQQYLTPEGLFGYLGCEWTVLVIDTGATGAALLERLYPSTTTYPSSTDYPGVYVTTG